QLCETLTMDDEDFDLNEFGQYEFDFESIWSDADSQCRAWHRELLKACQNDEIEEQNRIAKTLKECIEDQNDIQAKALLFMTVVTSNTQLLKVLTERLPDLCLRVKSDKNNNILHFACCCKQTDSAVQSLQIIWDKCGQQLIKEPNAEMRTPLHISAQNSQNPDLLRWLASTVKDKQQFFIKDNDGKSAVHVAFEYQDLETLQTLATELSLKNCLSVKCQGRQILHITAMISEDPSVLLWLVAKVEDKQRFFDPDEDGKSAVYVAFNYQELDTLQALTTELGLQSCVSAKGPRRRTISHAAAENRSIPSVLLWLVSEVEDKQRFFDPDEDRESAIHVAFSCLNLDTLQTLAKELGLKKCISVKGPRNRTILHAAAENSEDPSVFLWLVSELEEKQRFFDPDEDRQSAVHLAFRCQNSETLQKLATDFSLQNYVFSKGPRCRTLLHAAAENGSIPSVLLWVASEIKNNQRFFDPDEDGESAVHVAFRCQNSDTLQEMAIELNLLKCVSSKGPRNRTILHAAAENSEDPSVLLWLVSEVEDKQRFFDPDEDRESAIHVAFRCQNSDTLQELATELGLKKCLSAKGPMRRTILHAASENGSDPSVLLWLVSEVEGKQQFFDPDEDGESAVYVAFSCQNSDALQELAIELDLRKCVSFKNPRNRTILHAAAENSEDPSVLLWLVSEIEDKQRLFDPDEDGECPVHVAFRYQNSGTLQALVTKLSLQKCILSKGPRCRTILHAAAENGSNPSVLLWVASEVKNKRQFFDPDEDGESAVHVAFNCQNLDTNRTLATKLDLKKCFSLKSAWNRSILHVAAENRYNPSVLLWLASEVEDKQRFFDPDKDGKSALYVAFNYQEIDTLQALAAELTLQKCVSSKGSKCRTILHAAAKNSENPSVLLWLVSEIEDKQRFFDTNDGKSAVYVAFKCQEFDTLQALANELGLQKCVSAEGPRNRTILHVAAENSWDPSLLMWLASEVKNTQQLLSRDDDESTVLHYAFCYQNLSTISVLIEKLSWRDCLTVANDLQQTQFYHSVMNCTFPDVFRWLLEQVKMVGQEDLVDMHETDLKGNNMLHALFRNLNYFWTSDELEMLIDRVKLLVDRGVDPAAENESKQNCLFASEAYEFHLAKVLNALKKSPVTAILKNLQRNSEGLHVVHVFCSRFDLKEIVQELGNLCDLSSEKFLAVRVSDGPLKGATCLHFACESGHKENIEYLLQNGAKLQDETAAGQTCVDFAYNKGKLEVLIEVANDINKFPTEKSFSLRELLTLVDVAKKALKLPDKQSARNHLTKFNDSSLKASIQKDRTSTPKDAQEGRKKNDKKTEHDVERMSKTEESPEVQMLFRAFELDSTEMLRSLIGLGLVNDEIYDQFSKHILAQISKKQPNAKSPIMTTLLQYFSVQDGNSKALVLMEYAVLLEKPKLLTDLMLLPQFDIIPQTLRLLTYLKTKVDKSEILQRVQLQAYNTIINILDHLYANADEDTRELLFTYLTGSFRVSEDQRNAGPRFLAPHSSLLRRESSHADNDKPQQKRSNEARKLSSENDTASQKFKSVMDLVETLDCDDLFATECISNLVEQHWKRHPPLSWSRPQRCCTCNISAKVTIQQRFIIYSIFFLVFLLYFAWYVTDFSRTQQSPVPDIILLLYALSFTLQEVNDFINSISLKDLTILGRDMRIPRYFIDLFNYFDMAGLLLMWAGLVLKLLGHLSDPSLLRSCQVVLSVSFLFLGFRSVALLSYFKVTGPKINMLKSLLFSDLVPFMLVLLVLVYSFGIFFFNLLFPAFSDSRDAQALTKIFTVPVSLAFGMVESAQFESCSSSSLATGESCADEAGNKAYNGILVFVYLLLVNIVMWNLLIALFSRTVTELASRAEVLWRRNLFELLQEFAEVSPVPPPLSFPHYAWKLLQRCHACRCQPRSGEVSPADGAESSKPWWQHTEDFSGYPKDFKRFLIYQSEQLREHRPRLQWPVERNKGDIDVLKAHVENQVKDLLATQREDNEKMDERLDKLQQQMTNVMSILQQMQQQRQQ
ncbi:hypothetical protein BOX15_Mlig023028g1, partial [Macrostomum lignano]